MFTKVAIFFCFDVCSVRPPRIFQVQRKTSTVQPVFRDYLTVSFDYNQFYFYMPLPIKMTLEKIIFKVDCETPVYLFENTFIYRTSPVAASDSFMFRAYKFIKKETPAKILLCKFSKMLRTSFDRIPPDDCLFVFICEFWEVFQITSFIEYLWKIAFFMLQIFNHQIQ